MPPGLNVGERSESAFSPLIVYVAAGLVGRYGCGKRSDHLFLLADSGAVVYTATES